MAIGFPAIMANLATPVGRPTPSGCSPTSARRRSPPAIIDRVTPVAFGVIFALTGSVGPIIGQNYGARLMGEGPAHTDRLLPPVDRLRAIGLGGARARRAADRRHVRRQRRQRRLRVFFCRVGVVAWLFLACLFVANTAFNNLGFPMMSMVFNWGAGDARHDSVRDTWRPLWRGERRPYRDRPRRRGLWLIGVAAAYWTTAELARRLQTREAARPAGGDGAKGNP